MVISGIFLLLNKLLTALLVLLLFAEDGLLTLLSLLQTGHEARFLFRLGRMGLHGGAHLLLVGEDAEEPCLDNGDEQRQEIVVAQARSIVVKMNRNITGIRYIIHFMPGMVCDWLCMLMWV